MLILRKFILLNILYRTVVPENDYRTSRGRYEKEKRIKNQLLSIIIVGRWKGRVIGRFKSAKYGQESEV